MFQVLTIKKLLSTSNNWLLKDTSYLWKNQTHYSILWHLDENERNFYDLRIEIILKLSEKYLYSQAKNIYIYVWEHPLSGNRYMQKHLIFSYKRFHLLLARWILMVLYSDDSSVDCQEIFQTIKGVMAILL